MSNSVPRDLCWFFKRVWEEHFSKSGKEYAIQGRDLRAAKEYFRANFDDPDQIDWKDLNARIGKYLLSKFDGWKDADFPAYGFFEHISRYAIPKVPEKPQGRWTCRNCGKSSVMLIGTSKLCEECNSVANKE